MTLEIYKSIYTSFVDADIIRSEQSDFLSWFGPRHSFFSRPLNTVQLASGIICEDSLGFCWPLLWVLLTSASLSSCSSQHPVARAT